MAGTDNKCIVFLLGIFICFLLCVSPVCANGDLVNSTGLGYVADNSAYPDIDLNHDHILSEGSSDVSNGDDDKSNINSSNEKLEKSPIKNENNVKFEVVDSVEVGNFSSLNRELNVFIDNKDYKIVDYGTKDVRKVIDVEKSGKVQTFYLNRDYVYDDATDREFIHGIVLKKSENNNVFKDIVINGNGHFIDGCGLASIFKVQGPNIKICNLIFRNMSTIHDFYLNDTFGNKYPKRVSEDNAPIVLTGLYGSIFNCIFINNIGYSGGSILWRGDDGYIGHNMFVNNFARYLGGFTYVEGRNVTIAHNLVANCEARLDADALYVRNLSSCIVENNNFIKVNLTNSSFVAPDVVDGSLMDVDSAVLRATYMPFGYTIVDTFPIVYGTLFYNKCYYNLSDGIVVFTSYDDVENVLSLTLSKFVSPSLEMRKVLNIKIDKNDFSGSFLNLTFEEAAFQLIKHYTVYDVVDYRDAIALQSSTVKEEYDHFKEEMGLKDLEKLMVVLDVKFYSALIIKFGFIWNPNGFDVININGAGSSISTSNDEHAEKKFVNWSGDGIFVASNLKISDLTMHS